MTDIFDIIKAVIEASRAENSEQSQAILNGILGSTKNGIDMIMGDDTFLGKVSGRAASIPRIFQEHIAKATDMSPLKRELAKPVPNPTPEYVQDLKAGISNDMNTAIVETLNVSGGFSALPFMNMGSWFSSYLQAPDKRAMSDIAVAYYTAPSEFGQRPLLQRYWNKLYTPMIPEAYRLADQAAKSIITDAKYKDAMLENGYDGFWANVWRSEQEQFPTFEILLALLRRGYIDSSTYTVYMMRNGYPQVVADQLAGLKEVIPPLDDLIRFAVREAYVDHNPDKQYGEYESMASKMGLTAEKAGWYWYAHWTRIAINLMYENYYRGNWTKDKLAYYLKLADIHPDDREAIMAVAYQPPSIREMGYGFDVGAYSLEDIKKYRRWGGLSPEDADKAATAMVAYRTEGEKNALRTELMYAYANDKFDRGVLEQSLLGMNTPREAVDLWLSRADLYKERIKKPMTDTEGKLISSSEGITAYKIGLINADILRTILSKLDWTKDRIDLAIKKADYDISQAKPAPAEKKYTLLDSSQMHSLYLQKKIDKDFMLEVFIERGYNAEDAKLLVELYTYVEPSEAAAKIFTASVDEDFYYYTIYDELDLHDAFVEQGYDDERSWMLVLHTRLDQEYPILKKLYESAVITSEQLKAELMFMGMNTEDSNTLVKKTDFEVGAARLTSEKELTKAEIIKGVKNKVFDYASGISLLEDIGYNSAEANYVLQINGIVSAGDADSYLQMKRATEAYKKARGEKAMVIPDEALALEAQIKQTKTELDKERKIGANEQRIAELALQLSTLEARLRTVLAKSQ